MILGIGVDVIELDRVRRIMARHGNRFFDRVLTERERAYCLRHRDPAPSVGARFAAKEAWLKALGTGLAQGIGWHDVEVVRQAQEDPPRLELRGRAAELAARRGATASHLSISHERSVAVAFVILEGQA
ncbi:MAG: holo-ACP synthase [Acidobacteriota bacterium]|nr:holo-ACP synthase [Acidobacteriota bacterium]MDQ7088569.1 holo-ACP synthase [Acidobacteriota bacterium]